MQNVLNPSSHHADSITLICSLIYYFWSHFFFIITKLLRFTKFYIPEHWPIPKKGRTDMKVLNTESKTLICIGLRHQKNFFRQKFLTKNNFFDAGSSILYSKLSCLVSFFQYWPVFWDIKLATQIFWKDLNYFKILSFLKIGNLVALNTPPPREPTVKILLQFFWEKELLFFSENSNIFQILILYFPNLRRSCVSGVVS